MHNPHGIKLLTRLRVWPSHLCEPKFRNNFQDSLGPSCSCSRHIETTIHFFLYCPNYSNQRKTLFDKISSIKPSLLNQNDSTIVETFLFGSNVLNDKENALIIECINNRIHYNKRKFHSSNVMNPFKQITTSIEISNWFWITVFLIFQLFSCSRILCILFLIFYALFSVYHQGCM